MTESTYTPTEARCQIKSPANNSERIQWLRDYYFAGNARSWNNEMTSWTTGTPWDHQFEELTFYIVPETYAFHQTFTSSFNQVARRFKLPADFWDWSLVERKAWFTRAVMVDYLPREILPGDLIAGGRFNIMTSACLNRSEARHHHKRVYGKNGTRRKMKWLHDHGYGNTGATSGHLIPDYARVLQVGFKIIHSEIMDCYHELTPVQQQGPQGAQLRAMATAAEMPRDLAGEYSRLCMQLLASEQDTVRRDELLQMAHNLARVPWEPAHTFWEAVQSLWLAHMLVMSDENYPGPGTSFGRIDQYLNPYWEHSLQQGMTEEEGKEILKCFWIHANTAYDAMIRTGGNQGITAGYGQLLTLSGIGPDGGDSSNSLTFAILDVIDDLSPILEPKPNVRLHRGSPPELYERIVDMISASQGAPFLLNFDERSMAGMMLQARKAGVEHLIHRGNVHDYAPVGCLENTMQGNDRSGTVDANLNLLKAVEFALTGGYDLLPTTDPLTGKQEPHRRWGPDTGDPVAFATFEDFWEAYSLQTQHIIEKMVAVYDETESIRRDYSPTPYLSTLVGGCVRQALDVTAGGAELNFVTLEAVTFATTVDSLLAIKYLVFDQKLCTMQELLQALKDNWAGHEVLQAQAVNKTPKYGRDDDLADEMGLRVMELWTEETWKHRTNSTNRRFRPGMLSWNYWVVNGFILPASPDGRPQGRFLSNAICPSNGADTRGPTANVNSVGKVLGGKAADGLGDWAGFYNLLPNGSSHTMTFNPSLIRDAEHRQKFIAFLKGYVENGGSALQINMIDAEMLRDAQRHPEQYRNLLVRITGYNAYFTTIGKELQDEIIARETHEM